MDCALPSSVPAPPTYGPAKTGGKKGGGCKSIEAPLPRNSCESNRRRDARQSDDPSPGCERDRKFAFPAITRSPAALLWSPRLKRARNRRNLLRLVGEFSKN